MIGPVMPRDSSFADLVVFHSGEQGQNTVEKKEIKPRCFLVFQVLDQHFLSLRFREIMTNVDAGLIRWKENLFKYLDDAGNSQQAFPGGNKRHIGTPVFGWCAVVDRE